MSASNPLTDNASSHLKNALQVSTLLAAELPKMIGNPGYLSDAKASLAAIDDRIRAALAPTEAKAPATLVDYPRFVDNEPHQRQYPDQHPAEATLDYIANALRSHTRTESEKPGIVKDAVESYFNWKAWP